MIKYLIAGKEGKEEEEIHEVTIEMVEAKDGSIIVKAMGATRGNLFRLNTNGTFRRCARVSDSLGFQCDVAGRIKETRYEKKD